jgi:transposase
MDKGKQESKYQKRVTALKAVQNGEDVGVVARVLGVPLRTLFDWLAKYRQGGWHALKEGPRSGRPPKVGAAVMRWLYDAITLGDPKQYQMPFCLWTLNIVRTMLKKQKGMELSKSSASRLLRQMGLSVQCPIYRSYKQDPGQMRRYLEKTFPGLREKARRMNAAIYFVDEASVRSDHHRGTTWGATGRTPVVGDSGGRFSVKLISAVSARGDMRFATIEGKMNSERFIGFVKKLREDAGRPILVIADNAGYHSSKRTMDFARRAGDIITETLPCYAPELNPDEQVWNHAKARLGKLFIDSRQTMRKSILNLLRSIQKNTDLIRSFFQMKDTRYASL